MHIKSLLQIFPCLFTANIDETGLSTLITEWAVESSRGGLFFPRVATFNYFLIVIDSLSSASFALIQTEEFWNRFTSGFAEHVQRSILSYHPGTLEFPFLDNFVTITLKVFRKIYMKGRTRSKKDQSREREAREEVEENNLAYQTLTRAPPGTRNLPLREDLFRRASLHAPSSEDGDL